MRVGLSAAQSPAIKLLLLGQLQEALSTCGTGPGTVESLEAIPLHRPKDPARILYISALPLAMAKICHRPATEIAAELAAHLHAKTPASVSDAGQPPLHGELEIAVAAVPPGWLHFQLTEAGLANWLQFLTQLPVLGELPPPERPPQLSCEPASLFPAQYASARCCSLLRLAHREGLLALAQPHWHAIAPAPFPWLDTGALPSTLRLAHPAERRLISQLVAALDAKETPADCLKWATALSQAFESFHSACRIWGEVKTQSPKLAQARLGLILATLSALRLLLYRLGVPAPEEF
ncbi:DALR anticodon-binding domain-containing protein [Kamptonema formosum]|uniref:DALR anticodon-binding domain-containing protein n=1 Tax=Kamptonema formosum TaxID=331992 RepID=UPI0005C52FA5|nr:DALR anticodon-binding domain-containing protein [Oscillatoria sp. PCC 10802]